MKALLDTHALLWWLDGDERLSIPAREWIRVPDHILLAFLVLLIRRS
jgi:PIN domain nuclease of toxin-antitoxin system